MARLLGVRFVVVLAGVTLPAEFGEAWAGQPGCQCESRPLAVQSVPVPVPGYTFGILTPPPPSNYTPRIRAFSGHPPGTLGTTYKQFTRAVPDDKHPRTAVIEIFGAPNGLKLTMQGMDGWVDAKGVWRFETRKPPVLGATLVRRVLVWNIDGSLHEDLVRTVRLIPGRIVELDY